MSIMKILVTKGMVSYNRKLYKTNQTVEMDEAAGRRFIRLGVAVLLEETAADSVENEPVETVTPADEQETEEETVANSAENEPVETVASADEQETEEETVADSAENEPVETVEPAGEQEAEEETVVDLPTVDPTAVVKKGGRKKKATK